MRAVQVNSVYNFGSTGRIVADIEAATQNAGHDALIAYGYGESDSSSSHFRMQARSSVQLSILQTRLFGHHGFYNQRPTERLVSWLEFVRPDVVHLHNIHGHYLNIERLFGYLKARAPRVIWTLHDCWAFTGHCAYFDYAGCERWKKGCGLCPQRRAYPKSWILDRSRVNYRDKARLFDGVRDMTIVAPSRWLADLVGESFLGGNAVRVVPNGIDLSVFRPSESDFRARNRLNDKFILLTVASGFDPRKGLHHLVDLSYQLEPDEVIVVLGVNAEQARSLPGSMVGLPRTNSRIELAEAYSAADVLLNPTVEDNFPTVNLEALACGTPVVTFRTGGSPESVDERTGIVVEQGDVAGLLQAARAVRERGKAYYKSACLDRTRRMYNRDTAYREYIALYEEGRNA